MKAVLTLAAKMTALARPGVLFAPFHKKLRIPLYSLRILYPYRSVSSPFPRVRGGHSSRPLPYTLLGSGFLATLWGGRREKEDEVPQYIKQQLLKAQRALRSGDYQAASKAYHEALRRLATSQFAEFQVYLEARAVVLDKV